MVAIYQEGVLQIGTELIFEGTQQGIGFIIRDENLRAQTYKLDSRDRFGQFGDDKLKCAFTTNSDNPGVLNITYFDQEKLIIAGTFAFKGVSRDCQDTIVITDGRFDMHYVP